MSTTYQIPDSSDGLPDLLYQAMREYKPELHELGVKASVLLAAADGEGPALKKNGSKVAARIRVVPLMYRVLGVGDALLEIDADHWRDLFVASKVALLHHELCHLEIVTDGETDKPKRDDIGRPRLRVIPADVEVGDAFLEVIQEHGDDAQEFRNIEKAYGWSLAAKREGAGTP